MHNTWAITRRQLKWGSGVFKGTDRLSTPRVRGRHLKSSFEKWLRQHRVVWPGEDERWACWRADNVQFRLRTKLEPAVRDGGKEVLCQIQKQGISPHELSNTALALAGSIQAQAGRNPEEGETWGRHHRKVSQSPKAVTPCSATTISTLQRAPHHILQVKTGKRP